MTRNIPTRLYVSITDNFYLFEDADLRFLDICKLLFRKNGRMLDNLILKDNSKIK